MKIYITRHGKTEWNTIGKLQGWLDSPLTEEGIERAEKLSHRLKTIDFDHIYSSPQKRALDTAKILNTGQGDIKILDELRELGLGKWQGMKIEEVEKTYPEEYYLYFNDPKSYKSLEGEDFHELFSRVKKALKKIIDGQGENVLIVSHGVTIKAIIAVLKEMDMEDFVDIQVYTGTSLTVFELNEERFQCLVEGDDSHLFEDLETLNREIS